MPKAVAVVAREENPPDQVTFTAKPGIIGGLPQAGWTSGRRSTRP
jgi:acyl CoA:acetate/3-ketoacid CoA transferase